MQKEKTATHPANEGFEVLWATAAVQIWKERFISNGEATKSREDFNMVNLPGLIAVLIPVAAILMPVGIVWIVFWYKARRREMELQESLRVREFQHIQRLKELELEIEKTKAQSPGKPAQP
jgi:hypothetical protein